MFNHRGSKKGASGGIRTPDYVDPTAIYPSVLPEKVFYHTVRICIHVYIPVLLYKVYLFYTTPTCINIVSI